MSLKYDYFRFYWAVVTEKCLNSVKVSYLYAGILNDNWAFSPVKGYLLKVRLIPINS